MNIEQKIINQINARQSFTHSVSKNRYVVGFTELFKGSNPSIQYDDIYKDVYAFVHNTIEHKNLSFGGWLDTESGLYYVDIGYIFSNKKAAKRFAKLNNQIAFFDLREQKEIRV